jgi:hypothetical protein
MAEVKRLDLGRDILLSGENRDEVGAVLQDLRGRGARIVTPLVRVGKNWVAVCTQPSKLHEADRTSTLYLRELQAAQRMRSSKAALCEIQQVGFKFIVSGPTHEAVYACVLDLLEDGATLVSDAEQRDGIWPRCMRYSGSILSMIRFWSPTYRLTLRS